MQWTSTGAHSVLKGRVAHNPLNPSSDASSVASSSGAKPCTESRQLLAVNMTGSSLRCSDVTKSPSTPPISATSVALTPDMINMRSALTVPASVDAGAQMALVTSSAASRASVTSVSSGGAPEAPNPNPSMSSIGPNMKLSMPYTSESSFASLSFASLSSSITAILL